MGSMARIITIFVFVCLLFFFSCLSSELNKNHPLIHSLFCNGSIFPRTREISRKRAVIGHFKFKFVSFYGGTEPTWAFKLMSYDWSEFFNNVSFYGHVNPTWGLQITLYDWSELFQICALIWQG